jgi:pimeloyl-ACP methyl ester carboxylesterase
VRLAFLRLRSTSPSPEPPIVFLSGGPGGSGTAAARGPLLPVFLALREVADVIALDQRGAGMSKPSLVCREAWSHPLDRAVPREELLAMARERSRSCAAMLRSEGTDLAGYNVVESADDLEDLRLALGTPTLQLLGTSYGTQLALTALRRHPGSFKRVVLLSAKGPQHGLRLPSSFESQLSALGRAIASDPEARREFPDFPATLAAVLARLKKEPVSVEVPRPMSQGKTRLVVGPFDLQVMAVQALGSRQETERLPARVRAMARGDFQALGQFALGLRRGWLGAAMPYLVECAAGLSTDRLARIRREIPAGRLGEAVDFPFPEICAGWNVPDLGPEWRRPVQSAVPTLLVSGSLDVRTPPADAAEIRRELSNGVLLQVEGVGHGEDFLAAPEVLESVRQFFLGKAVTPRPIALPRLKFRDDPLEKNRER